jgi:hypothetical protein
MVGPGFIFYLSLKHGWIGLLAGTVAIVAGVFLVRVVEAVVSPLRADPDLEPNTKDTINPPTRSGG